MPSAASRTVGKFMKTLAALFTALLLASFACAQQSARPRIGLVLEGGGARGLAHVGVIRWLEEHHIPVDYVAGTSMGGLVGGMYAAGQSPTDLRALVKATNWNDVLAGQIPYRELSFRRKEDREQYPNRFEFGLKQGVQFPSGFNAGHQVGLILDRVALPYTDLKSFDDLPIPFRCVATDLVSGQAKVFDRGSLAEALRATMSIPGFFTPVRRNNTLYVDGGLLDNLPVDVARNMGADIVIAIHLRTEAYDAKAAASSFGILSRSVSLLIARNEMLSMEKANLVVTADVTNYNLNDYNQFEAIEAKGYEAASAQEKMLSMLRVSDAEWAEYTARRAARRAGPHVPQFVEVKGSTPAVDRALQHELADVLNKPLDADKISQAMTSITGIGRFSRAGYQMVERNGQYGLLVNVEEKEYAPPTVNPLLLIDGTNYQKALFSVGARFTFPDVGGVGSEWRTDVIAGSQYGVRSEYYHPFSPLSHWFIAPRGGAESLPFDLYADQRPIAEYRERRLYGGADVGYDFGKSSELRFGYEAGRIHLSRQIGSPSLGNLAGRTGVTTLRYRLERLDDPVIPRSGVRFETRAQWVDANPGATHGFPVYEGGFGGFQRISRKGSLFVIASGGTTFGRPNDGLPAFSLGGPLRLSAYGSNELLNNQYLLLQPGYIRRIKQLSPLVGKATYLFTSYEYGRAYDTLLGNDRSAHDFNAGILVETLFGPIVFGGSVGDANHRKFYFKVGRFF